MKEEWRRQVRSDRKRDIKPTIDISLHDAIYRLSYITRTPVKDVCEAICVYGINSSAIRGKLAVYFRRNIRINNTLYNGNLDRKQITKRTSNGVCERISLRLSKDDHEVVNALAYGLDCSTSRACALLLEQGMKDFDFVDNYVRKHLEDSLDDKRLQELKKVMRYVSGKDAEIDSWASLLSAIVDEVKKPVSSTKELVSEFLINTWNK